MSNISRSIPIEIYGEIIKNIEVSMGLKRLVEISTVSKKCNRAVDDYCKLYKGKSLIMRGLEYSVEVYPSQLWKLFRDFNAIGEYLHNVKNIVKNIIDGKYNMTVQEIKCCFFMIMKFDISCKLYEGIRCPDKFKYSYPFVCLLKKAIYHQDLNVKAYILNELKPRLLKEFEPRNEIAFNALKLLGSEPINRDCNFILFLIILVTLVTGYFLYEI